MASSSPYRSAPPSPSNGARLVSTSGHALPLAGSVLSADAAGGVARVVLEQRFVNTHAEPLIVTYKLPLPADGAVSGFAFTVGGRRVVGEIDLKRAARERYEDAILSGKTAALLEQERSSVFTQEIGNIPPGEEVTVEVTVDQRLLWLDEGAWEWRFPTVVGPRYMGSPAQTPDAARITVDVADGVIDARVRMSCAIRDALPVGRVPDSPSHLVRSESLRGATSVELREREGAALDRDLVVRWPVATPKVGLSLDVGRVSGRPPSEHAHGLVTLVPPTVAGRRAQVARDLIVLLDTSGSMGGEPLAQAVRVTSAMIETLRDHDQLELIEFSSAARRWKRGATRATASARRDAIQWLKKLQASGSTDMHEGIREAMSSLRGEAQRQIVLITDGMIGFEAQIVAEILEKLPSASRVHTVGVGSSVNRSLTGPAARAGHGVEIIVGIGEDAERAASRIVARTDAPLVVDVAIGGSAFVASAPAKLPDLFAASPALISVALRPEGGELVVTGRTGEGTWVERVHVDPIVPGAGSLALAALFGREKVEDLELRRAAGEANVDPQIERAGLDFQIATRLTSWVAIAEEANVDPRDPVRRETMPHMLPHGMSAEGVGLRASAVRPSLDLKARFSSAAPAAPFVYGAAPALPARVPPPQGGGGDGAGTGRATHGAPPSLLDEDFDDLDRAKLAAPPPPRRMPLPAPAPASKEEAPPVSRISVATSSDRSDDDEADVAKMKKGGGILGALRDFFRGGPKTDEGAGALRGRVVARRGTSLTLEIVASELGLAWSVPTAVRVTSSNGEVVVATIDLARTTGACSLAPSAAARLALTLPAAIEGDITLVEIEVGGLSIAIPVG